MGAVDKRQDLDMEQASLLALMGVQVWYARETVDQTIPSVEARTPATAPTSSALKSPRPQPPRPKSPGPEIPTSKSPGATPTPIAEPATPVATRTPDLIQFSWVKGRTGMIVCPLTLDRTTAIMLRDVLIFADWMRGEKATRTSQGEFRWPQLLDTTVGTPVRALSAFVDKHLPDTQAWLGITPEVAPDLDKWLADLPVKVIQLPSLQDSIGNPGVKQAIWSLLKNNV